VVPAASRSASLEHVAWRIEAGVSDPAMDANAGAVAGRRGAQREGAASLRLGRCGAQGERGTGTRESEQMSSHVAHSFTYQPTA
jgi:hypothetical protein